MEGIEDSEMNCRNRFAIYIVTTATLCVLCNNVYGQGNMPSIGHFKKTNPNEIFVDFIVDDGCNGTHEQVVDNELVRSRIKRKHQFSFGELKLFVRVNCIQYNTGRNFIYDVDVRFGRYIIVTDPKPNTDGFYMVHYSPYYGVIGITSTGIQGEQVLRNNIRESVEKALTDYLRANFDL